MKFDKSIFLILFSFLALELHAQVEQGFTPYNKKRIGCCFDTRRELLFSSNITVNDYDTDGNLADRFNYGFGLGYSFRVLKDGFDQSIAIGAKAEWYPNSFVKFNSIVELDLLGYASGKLSGWGLSGFENQITFLEDFSEFDFHFLLYMFELNYGPLELKWGLQTTWESFKPSLYLDDTFNVFKLTYRYYL